MLLYPSPHPELAFCEMERLSLPREGTFMDYSKFFDS